MCALLAGTSSTSTHRPGAQSSRRSTPRTMPAAALAAYVARALPAGDHPICQCVVNELPARALLESGREASMLVVGARGLGGFRGLLLGSVSQRCAHLTTTPLVGAPTRLRGAARNSRQRGQSDSVCSALHWAVDEGRRRRQPVQALHAWHERVLGSDAVAMTVDPGPWERAARSSSTPSSRRRTTRSCRTRSITSWSTAARAGALVEASSGAQLVVVGNRGHNTLALGSVAQQVLHHAHCPGRSSHRRAEATTAHKRRASGERTF